MSLRPDDIREGQPTTVFGASDYNDLVEAIRRNLNSVPTLPLGQDANAWTIARKESIWALLSGSSSPYSFTESIPGAGGIWTPGTRTGIANAYEVNGVSGLGGKRALLRPGYPFDWRFQHVAEGTSGGGGAVCTCWTAGTLPTTLNWSLHTQLTSFDLSTTTDLGTTSGTATLAASTTVGDASCPTFDGWLGEFSFYVPSLDEAGGPGGGAGEGETTITPVLIPHCASGFFAPDDALYPGCTSSNCRWISITCDPTYILDVKIIGSEVITCSGSPAATNCYYHPIFILGGLTYGCTPSFFWRCNILGLSPMLIPPFGLINIDLLITA